MSASQVTTGAAARAFSTSQPDQVGPGEQPLRHVPGIDHQPLHAEQRGARVVRVDAGGDADQRLGAGEGEAVGGEPVERSRQRRAAARVEQRRPEALQRVRARGSSIRCR